MRKTKKDIFKLFIKGCMNGDTDIINRILNSGIDVNENIDVDINLISKGICLAMENDQYDVIEFIIKKSIHRFKLNPIVLIKASEYGYINLVKVIVEEYKDTKFMIEKTQENYINDETITVDSALCWAMEYRYDEIVNILKNVMQYYQSTYYASFISACRNGFIDIVKIILESELDLTRKNTENDLNEVSIIDSALYWAIENHNDDIVECIMNEKKFDTKKFYASFISACKNGYIDVAQKIIEDGIELDKIHKENELNETSVIDSALYWAMENRYENIIEYLVNLSFDARKCDNTFIRAYVENNNKIIFSLLLNGFNRKERLNKYNFWSISELNDDMKTDEFIIINIDISDGKYEKILKYFLINNIDKKESILLISKNKIKNHIKILGNFTIENFDINKDFYKIEKIINHSKK